MPALTPARRATSRTARPESPTRGSIARAAETSLRSRLAEGRGIIGLSYNYTHDQLQVKAYSREGFPGSLGSGARRHAEDGAVQRARLAAGQEHPKKAAHDGQADAQRRRGQKEAGSRARESEGEKQ